MAKSRYCSFRRVQLRDERIPEAEKGTEKVNSLTMNCERFWLSVQWVDGHFSICSKRESRMGCTVPKLKWKSGENVWYITYYCRFRRHSRLISTRKHSKKEANRKLEEFIKLFEAGLVGRDFSFIKLEQELLEQERQEYEQRLEGEKELLIERVLPEFEKVHRAGGIRQRGDRKETQQVSTQGVMSQLGRVLDGLTRIDEISPGHLITWGKSSLLVEDDQKVRDDIMKHRSNHSPPGWKEPVASLSIRCEAFAGRMCQKTKKSGRGTPSPATNW